ncbi:DUF6350 family protein [Frankia sp. Cr2]|uniref:cell division protein PerM n=1 Tax=Frankia sp. Cr2 TaxID=3073932 RepID=UPI002AD44906|nr:DUF6350 family protein [Frankia sp. Cr2]
MANSFPRGQSRSPGVRLRAASRGVTSPRAGMLRAGMLRAGMLRMGASRVLTAVRAARGDLAMAAMPPIAGLAMTEIVVVLFWVSDQRTRAGGGAAVRVAADLWLIAHGTSFATPDGDLSLVPLGLALLPIALTALAGHRLVRGRSSSGEAPRRRDVLTAVRGRDARLATPRRSSVGRPVAMVVAFYAIVTVVTALAADDPAAHPSIPSALLGAMAMSLTGASAGALVATCGQWRPGVTARIPTAVRTTVSAAGAAVAVLIAAGAMITAGVLAVNIQKIASSADRLAPGQVGGTGVLFVHVALLPNVVVWAAAYALGPGFATGVHGFVRPFGVHLADVPELPMFAGLPTTGASAPVWLVFALAPVTAGCIAARMVRRDDGACSVPVCLARVALASVLCGIAMAALAAASGGSLGAGELASFGPPGIQVGLAATAEVGVAAVLATCAAAAVRGRTSHRLESRESPITSLKRCRQTAGSWFGSFRQS